MNATAHFLTALGQTLAAMSLYADAHPTRVAARGRALTALRDVLADRGSVRFSFLDGQVVVGTRVMTELRGWDWGRKLADSGVQRLEADASPVPTDVDLDVLLGALHERLLAPADSAFPPIAVRGLRAGPVSVADHEELSTADHVGYGDILDAWAVDSLDLEQDTVRWIHEEVANARELPMAEVEAVVHSLASAMHRDHHVILPLLELKSADQYTTTHACNVAMLSMGLAEQVGLGSKDVRAVGTAALLHDIGKVAISQELLVKPGKLSAAERAEIERHPVEGAKILSVRGRGHALAAVVAYEHHVWMNGEGGYPRFTYPRACHYASRLVHVCDLYDALSTRRRYRDAWPRQQTLDMLLDRSGIEVDTELVGAFVVLATTVPDRRADAAANAAGSVVISTAAGGTGVERPAEPGRAA